MSVPPPSLGAWLLRPLLPGGDGPPLLGDLEEQFTLEVVPRLGARAARRWYLKECLWAATSLLLTGLVPRGAVGLMSFLLVALPLACLEHARGFVLSQIPFKDGPDYGRAFLLWQLLGMAILCAVVARLLRLCWSSAPAGGPVTAVAASALSALALFGGPRPAVYWVLGLPVVLLSAARGALGERRPMAPVIESGEAR